MKKYLVILMVLVLAVCTPFSVAVSATKGSMDDNQILVSDFVAASDTIHVKSFTVEDRTVMDGVDGSYRDFNGTTGNFYFDIRPAFTVELEDGTILHSGENGIEIDDNTYNLYYEFTDGSSITNPSVGTHHAIGYFMGVEDEFDVTVLESPVASIEITDMTLQAYMDDGYFADSYYYYYYAGGSGNPLYIYELHPTFTVTLKDGSELQSHNGAVVIDGVLCDVFGFSANQPAQPFLPGNTYSVTGYFMGASDTFNVTVTDDAIAFPCGKNVGGVLNKETATLTIKGTGPMRDFPYVGAPWFDYPIRKVIIEDGVTSVGDCAFTYSMTLTDVIIADSVNSIGKDAFSDCSELVSINIPNSVTLIDDEAFQGSWKLKEIVIPDSVTSIGKYAFSDCDGLTVVTIPDSVTSLGDGVFSTCTYLKNVTLSNRITSIPEYMFFACEALTDITIPEGVTSVGHAAFYDCGKMTSVTLPNSMVSIEGSAFRNCNMLTDVYYNGIKAQWDAVIIENENNPLLNATLHVWEEYTVTYNLNGGTNHADNPKSYTKFDATITLKDPTRKGYTFKGWYSDSKLTKKVTKIASGSTGNKTLYAKWAKTYTITYKLNGGTNNKSNPKSYTKIDATITLKNPTRKGYTFKGWYSDSKFKKKVTKIAKGSTGNKTLYAKWAKNTYKITYKLNKGKNSAKNPKTYTVTTKTITLKNPTRKGYTFIGWYVDAKYKTKVTKITKGSTGNKTLYAKWKKK